MSCLGLLPLAFARKRLAAPRRVSRSYPHYPALLFVCPRCRRVSVRALDVAPQAAEEQLLQLCQAPECLMLLLQIVVEPQVMQQAAAAAVAALLSRLFATSVGRRPLSHDPPYRVCRACRACLRFETTHLQPIRVPRSALNADRSVPSIETNA